MTAPDLPFPSPAEILAAVQEGVFAAMPSGSEVTDAVEQGVFKSMPYGEEVRMSVGGAVEAAMPTRDEILGAIQEGVAQAHNLDPLQVQSAISYGVQAAFEAWLATTSYRSAVEAIPTF